MKKWISFIALFLGLASFTFAQKFCYVDSQYILENLPEYTSSQNRLKSQTESWQKEIEQKQENLAKLQAEFEAEKILLTAEQVKEQEKKLAEEIQAVKSLQDKRYGPTGDLVNLRRSMVKPLQDQIYNATKEVADKRGYSFVFDKGSDLIMIYTDPKFDISREVLQTLKPELKQERNNTNTNTKGTSASKKKK
ncbi:outer membrane protein [Algoriella xinjiangensis]|uniref:Outer membrane protein n=1 Tax=Algoriella xinjiangensis TaxID=684065 RepID=A0A1I4ZE77_9FLAO|nr:OmpH family outer membrane protein [Algoriella xinjiangensis]SFN48566.1 outer membrane protein [Algoriella xinjiangensis]VDH17517.1 Outer membrane protein [Algoriella xinjiangensis]